MACGPCLLVTSTARAAPVVGADACWWPQPWNWLATTRMLKLASAVFSKLWRPRPLAHSRAQSQQAIWQLALSPQVQRGYWSASSRDFGGPVKRDQRETSRKPLLTLFSTASSGSSAFGRIPGYARLYLDRSVL